MSLPDDEIPDQVRHVAAALTGLGAQHAPRPLPGPAHTAAQAAAQLGTPVAAIANSLIFACDGRPLLAITSGGHRADPLTLAALLGAGSVRPATPAEVRKWTHQPIGGVAPVGHPHPLHTLVDVELAHFDTVWCGAGHPHWVFPTSYAELLRITAGEAAEVGDLSVTEAP
jgi:prolyl-tRNA editing enzyme YbaK/EbsC (Cys-tRNA(Pro) deacylase)